MIATKFLEILLVQSFSIYKKTAACKNVNEASCPEIKKWKIKDGNDMLKLNIRIRKQ